jgi:succinoglycan biosynthesis transport protein ExoP
VPLISANELSKLDRGVRSPAHMIVAKPMSRASESIRVLLSQINTGRIDNDCMVVAVTSALAHEGKTTVATSLGQIAALSGMRVLLIEGDLRMRSLSKHTPPVSAGLVEALRKEVTWNSVLVTDPETGAHFLPVKSGGFTLGNVFATRRMWVVLAEMRPDYDLIIIDCPPVLAVADARTLAFLADGTVIISRWNRTPAPAVRTAIREIESAGGRVVGVVLNRLKPSVAKRISHGDSLYFGAAGSKYYEG